MAAEAEEIEAELDAMEVDTVVGSEAIAQEFEEV
jgi:hypothetical protein